MTFSVSETVELSRWWWTFILRGLLAIAFGILAFLAPVWGVAILVALFGAWALIDGVTSVWTGVRTRNVDRNWWLEILEGLVSVAVGVIAFAMPDFAAEVLVILIAVWAIVTGVFQIWAAIRLRERIRGEFWLEARGGGVDPVRCHPPRLPGGRRTGPRVADRFWSNRHRRVPHDPGLAPAWRPRDGEARRGTRLQPLTIVDRVISS